MPHKAEPHSGIIGKLTLTFALSLIVISLFAILIYKGSINDALENAENTGPNKELMKLRAYESDQLHSYKWIDKTKGTVQIPIESAKQKVLESYH